MIIRKCIPVHIKIIYDGLTFALRQHMSSADLPTPRTVRDAASEAPLTQEDYQRLAYFRHHIRKFLVFSETAARAAGLTPRQHQALLAIYGTRDSSAPTIGELSQKLLIRHHSAVGLTDRLVSAGFIRRVNSPRDQREVMLRLTPKAKRVLFHLSKRHRSELNRIAPVLRAILSQLEGRTHRTRQNRSTRPPKRPLH
ncbi:MarR family transcriptional regulator [mine drainage metagenome]|uniref:MarR family transcriptional regulator n=1 Tax=mine drainage metagenome TaxID=410659 RepID=T0YIX4_9ZZZZ